METKRTPSSACWRLGVVSYLNAKPLVAGLEDHDAIDIHWDVPSKLAPLLDERRIDAALVPVIDFVQPTRCWTIVSDACIGCDGETFTVRVFSRVPPDSIRTLQVDGDSHTSVALARVLWAECYGRQLEIVPYEPGRPAAQADAVLLIGDKVVTHSLRDYEIETDLGSAWKSLTSLPFVFAAWAAPSDRDVAPLARLLSQARDMGVQSAAMIAADFGPGMGWPVALATRYLTSRLKFTLGPRQKLGMQTFFELARRHDIIQAVPEPVFSP